MSSIDDDLQKIFNMLSDINGRTKDPRYRALVKKLKKQYKKTPKCPTCGNPVHDREHHCCLGEWK